MLHMRPYRPSDAETIISWCGDEYAFRQWTADRYDHYPITPQDMNAMYEGAENVFPMTAWDENGIAGHLILRYPDASRETLRVGFVIVDSARRGQGLGRDMLDMALCYAFGVARAKQVSMGVFENNPAAKRCYEAAGFRDVTGDKQEYYAVLGERWPCREMLISRDEWRKRKWN